MTGGTTGATTGGDRGFTLLELVAAMAIFALVALMGLQALSGTLRARDRLMAADADSAQLTTALSLLRADLDAAVGLAFRPPDGSAYPALALSGDGLGFSVSVAGQPRLPGEAVAGLGRVEWRLDPGARQLLRRAWPVLAPLDAGQARAETVELDGVQGWELRVLTRGQGWLAGRDWAAQPVGIGLPRALEVTLFQARVDRVRVLVALP